MDDQQIEQSLITYLDAYISYIVQHGHHLSKALFQENVFNIILDEEQMK